MVCLLHDCISSFPWAFQRRLGKTAYKSLGRHFPLCHPSTSHIPSINRLKFTRHEMPNHQTASGGRLQGQARKKARENKEKKTSPGPNQLSSAAPAESPGSLTLARSIAWLSKDTVLSALPANDGFYGIAERQTAHVI